MAASNRFTLALAIGTMMSSVAMFGGAPAFAQSAIETDEGEVVVTAQRREERLRDVPISVTAVTADMLEESGVSGATELAAVTPGMTYPVSGAFAQPTIRGIGTTVTSAGSDANVALYVDGVYMPSQAGNIFEFNNIQRIEVLKGPQGTLFGRNATGGAISITTLAPSQTPTARLGASYGELNERRVNAYGSTGFTDAIAGDIALMYRADDGYSTDANTGADLAWNEDFAVRSQVRFDLSDRFTVTVAGDYNEHADTIGYALKPLNGNTSVTGAVIPSDPREASLSFEPEFDTLARGASVRARYGFDALTVTSTSAWRLTDAHFLTDLDRTAQANSFAQFDTRQRTFIQELNFAGELSERLSWIGGLFYYDDAAYNENPITNGAPGVQARIGAEAIAAYAELQFNVSDRLTLIGGTRYSTEERTYDAIRLATGATVSASDEWSAWTPRVAARYALTDSTNIYASFSQGFKSGTYNATGFSTTPVNPEYVDAYEIGLKYFAGGVSFNTSAFFYSYEDIQIQAIQVSTGLTALTNAAEAEVTGVDAEFSVPLGENWSLRGGAAYLQTEYTSFPGALITTPVTNPATCGVRPAPCGNTQAAGDASGNEMVRSPELTLNLGLGYEAPFAGGSLAANLSAYHNGGFYWDVGNRLKEDAYTTFNGRIAWGPENGNWEVALWGRNLTDELYAAYTVDTTAGDSVAYARPRTIGVSFDLRLN